MALLFAILLGILSIIVPGFFLSLALLKKTKLNMFEIIVIGVIFGLIFPPAMIWFEAYFIPFYHGFTFSAGLYNINVVILTLIGITLSYQQGALNGFMGGAEGKSLEATIEQDYKKRISGLRSTISTLSMDLKLVRQHEKEEQDLTRRNEQEMQILKDAGPEERKQIQGQHVTEERRLYEQHEHEENMLLHGSSKKSNNVNYVYVALMVIMLIAFITRIENIGSAIKYFEFDPYYDMISTQYILVDGFQHFYDNAAWPGHLSVSIHRIQPIVPYLEAYWYSIAGGNSGNASIVNTDLLSLVSSWYPPLMAALLVFVIFILIYHQYGGIPALTGAILTLSMPTLITTFIAGEQLLEPWGIFAMFFFYATYLLAANNPKEKRFAILAGIAFASNFLGAHYYTVPAAVLALYIILQGLVNIFRRTDNTDFYTMNTIVLGVIILSYLIYNPYKATLTSQIPNLLGIPIIIAGPLFAFIFIALMEFLPKYAKQYKMINTIDVKTYLGEFVLFAVIALALALTTSLGNPIRELYTLSVHFTTPSTPLFMTVQEYATTGLTYGYGAAGFGNIGNSIGGVSIVVMLVLAIYLVLESYFAIWKRNSQAGIFSIALIVPLALAGFSEVKYLPHFGIAYIIAICTIIGELLIMLNQQHNRKNTTSHYLLYGFVGLIILIEFVPTMASAFGAALNPNCATINKNGNAIGAALYCNTVPQYWLSATSWMRSNAGPYAARFLSWWDYGDWINWFGNSNAVLRGDNAYAKLDYATAAHFVFTSNSVTPYHNLTATTYQNLSGFMNSMQAKYLVLDDQLVQKWGALDFLACIDTNQTTRAFAIAAGGTSPFQLGTSQCEVSHDPVYVLIPLSQSINNYCTFSNSSLTAVKSLLIFGGAIINQTYCVPISYLTQGNKTFIYSSNGTKTNLMLPSVSSQYFLGQVNIGGQPFFGVLGLYLPNGPNGTIRGAATEFYNSTYYKGFFLGKIPGYTLVYPQNFSGVNFINSTNRVMIFQLNNYTGGVPNVTAKPSWVHNNYTLPG